MSKKFSAKELIFRSPYVAVGIISFVIFFCEVIIMALFPLFFDTHHTLSEILFDGIFLLILLSPSLYYLLLRPAIKHIEERREIENQLKNSHRNLEQLIENKTVDLKKTNQKLKKKFEEQRRLETSLRESQEQYVQLIETLTDAIVSVDGTGRIIQWNDAAARIFGYSKSEIMHQPVTMLIPEKYLKPHQEGFNRFVNSGEKTFLGKTVSMEGLTKYGAELPIELSLSAFQKEKNWIITSIIRNVSERKKTEKEIIRNHDTQKVINELLRASITEQPMSIILNNCLDSILSIQWLTVKPKGCIYLVEDKKDILIMKAQKGLGPDIERKCTEVPFGKCICGRAAASKKIVYADKIDDRHDIIMETDMEDHGHYCVPILAGSGTLGVINIYLEEGHLYDEIEIDFLSAVANTMAGIIMRRHTEKEKQQIEMKLRHTQQLESIGKLAGGIAHDFNNILSSIIGFTELALDDVPKNSLIDDNLQEVYTAGRRAKELVGQILTFASQSDEKLRPVQVDEIVKEALKFIRSSIPTTIEIKDDINSDSLIMGDQTQIHQIMMNFCTNAAHAMEDDGGILNVSLRDIKIDRNFSEKIDLTYGDYIELTVSDTGRGIAPEIITSIFEPYFTTKETGKGTGMGLAMVHGIVESYGGKIFVDSNLGKGTTFTTYFPVTRKRNSQRQYEPKPLPTGVERILFVDDEAPIAKMGSQGLERLGYQVTTRTSSIEALELFRSKPDNFDLIITDKTMPNMTGNKLAIEMMKIRSDIPVILCTGYSNKISDEFAANIGIKAFAYKPVVKADLAKIVRKVLDEAKSENQD